MGKNLGGKKQKSKKNGPIKQYSVPINDIKPDNIDKFIATVTKNLGSYRLNVKTCTTLKDYNALIPGSFRNKIWINTNDYVLIEISELSGCNCHVMHKYDSSELSELERLGLFKITAPIDQDDSNIIFTFDTLKKAGGTADDEILNIDDI